LSKNSFIFEPKVEKNDMGVFSTQFVPLISILAPKNKIVNFKNADFCKLLRPRSSWK
jgi:hypothetical protein